MVKLFRVNITCGALKWMSGFQNGWMDGWIDGHCWKWFFAAAESEIHSYALVYFSAVLHRWAVENVWGRRGTGRERYVPKTGWATKWVLRAWNLSQLARAISESLVLINSPHRFILVILNYGPLKLHLLDSTLCSAGLMTHHVLNRCAIRWL